MSRDPAISCISFFAGYRIFVFLSTVNEVVRFLLISMSALSIHSLKTSSGMRSESAGATYCRLWETLNTSRTRPEGLTTACSSIARSPSIVRVYAQMSFFFKSKMPLRKPSFLLSAMHSHAFCWFSAAPLVFLFLVLFPCS